MINKTIIQGRLTNVPELKQVGGNHTVGTVTIAWNKKYNDKETTLFLRCKFWNAKATFLNNHFTKGSEIIVSGELQTESWNTEDGSTRSITVLNVDECHFCGPKESNPKTQNQPYQPPVQNQQYQNINVPPPQPTQSYMNAPQQMQPTNYQQQNLTPQSQHSVGDYYTEVPADQDDDFPY